MDCGRNCGGRCSGCPSHKKVKHTPEEILDKLASLDGLYVPEMWAWVHTYRNTIKELKDQFREALIETEHCRLEAVMSHAMTDKEAGMSAGDRLVRKGLAKWTNVKPSPEELWKAIREIQEEKARKRAMATANSER